MSPGRYVRIVVSATLVVLSLLNAACSPPEPPNILFIVMDTVRADHLSHRGWRNDTTPNLRALLSDSVLYSQAHSVAPWTLPSHMSMFTGMLPGRHRANWAAFDSEEPMNIKEILQSRFSSPFAERMLPRVLKQHGYATVGVSSNPWISLRTGFDGGFDVLYPTWKGDIHPSPDLPPSPLEMPLDDDFTSQPAGRALLALNGHVREHGIGEPFFLFFNFIDPHYPYISDGEKGFEFGGDQRFFRTMENPRRRKQEIGIIAGDVKIDFDKLVPFYDACIHSVDRAIGQLVHWLKDNDLYDTTMIVITSDHGEHLGEGGRFSHQLSIEEELLRVPLVIKYPDSRGGGAVEDNAHVSVADVYETVLRAVSADRERSGYSQDLGQMDRFDRPFAVAEYYYSNSYLNLFDKRIGDFDLDAHRTVRRVIYAGGRKFVFEELELKRVEPIGSATPQTRDAELERQLLDWLQRYVSSLETSDVQGPADSDHHEFVEELKALGYVR